MKKSLLFLFLLVLGVTQGWAYDELTSAVTVTEDKVYQVTGTRTINGSISVGEGKTLTIYISKGRTLTVKAVNSTNQTGASPAIAVPDKATLIVTGAGTLKVIGGKAAPYRNGYGGGGASPAIGGVGGNGAASPTDGGVMGTVYIRGNVTVRAARGISYGRKATKSHGADGGVPTYAIGGGGGGGANSGAGKTNGKVGGAGTLWVEKTARVIYLNGKRRSTLTKTQESIAKNEANTVTVSYTDYDSSTEHDVPLSPNASNQTITEYGFININNKDYYSRISTPVTSPNPATGFDQVKITTKKVKNWTTMPNGQGTVYNPKDLVLADGTGEGVAQKKTLKLYANWEENSAVTFNVIHNADELMKFARMVNGTEEYENNAIEDANGILMADIDMTGKDWIPIGLNNVQDPQWDGGYFGGVFDGNGYIISNLTMERPSGTDVTDIWKNVAEGRAGLFGYAKGATIRNVVVKNATIWGKWQIAAVCGRLDNLLDNERSKKIVKPAYLENCGSFGELNLNLVELYGVTNYDKEGGNSRVIGGVVTTDGAMNNVNSVWSTYSGVDQDTPSNTPSNKWKPRKNHVVAVWNNNNSGYETYTQNSAVSGSKRTWVYVKDQTIKDGTISCPSLADGTVCYQVNGDPSNGVVTWTQTFVPDDNKNAENEIVDKDCFSKTNSYADCPRPTSRGLPVYKDAENVYSNHIYTISFESNGGTDCDDIYITRKYNVTDSYTYPELPTTTRDGRVFEGWYDSDSENATQVTSTSGISSDITLYAQWNQTMTVKVNQDPKVKDYYYCTFYYSDQAYKILTPGALAYTAKREDDVASLTMESVKDVNGNISKIIPAGEAVILRVKVPDVVEGNDVIKLQAVDSDADIDPYNILYGSDEEVLVEDVSDDIPDTSDNAAEDATRTNCYVFSGNATNGIGFYLPKAKYTTGENKDKYYLKAHMAFALLDGQIKIKTTASTGTNAKTLSMIFEDDEEQVTGISEHKSESETKKAIFSINGMPLSKLQKGINIVGGKKVFVK